MSAAPEERLRIALMGVSYFADTAALDLENGDREELRSHLSQLRQIVIQALQAAKELPPPPWPDAATREAFGRDAAEWRAQRDRDNPLRDYPDATGDVWADAERDAQRKRDAKQRARQTAEMVQA